MFLFISTGEVVFLLFAVLMLFGTDKLPEIARMAARTIKMVRNASNDLKDEISKAADTNPTIKEAKESVKEIKGLHRRHGGSTEIRALRRSFFLIASSGWRVFNKKAVNTPIFRGLLVEKSYLSPLLGQKRGGVPLKKN